MSRLLEQLKDGKKFPLCTLAYEDVTTSEFWKWWWDHKASFDTLVRPEIIDDQDPILIHTKNHTTYDEETYSALLTPYFAVWEMYRQYRCNFRRGARPNLHDAIVNALLIHTQQSDEKQIVFAAGGYAAGKTSTLQLLAKERHISMSIPALLGVDRCKHLIPEFTIIQEVGDGRASMTVQAEAVHVSEMLFSKAIEEGRSFGWDSSMSDLDKSLAKIDLCRQNGYSVDVVGVLAEPATAYRRAMERALESRRFANPQVFRDSHLGFLENFEKIAEVCDSIQLYDNTADGENGIPDPIILAIKDKNSPLNLVEEQRIAEIRSLWSI